MSGSGSRQGLVSVITPCYNAAEFVGETIESVRAQTYAPIEHIVVDDASTDGSWDVICRHGPVVRRVRLERNQGCSAARIRGAHLARGEYLMFLDADDFLEPRAIAALVEAVRAEPRGVAVCDWTRWRRHGETWQAAPADAPFPPGPDPLRGWLEGKWVPPCAVLWRREAYEHSGGWDEAVSYNDDGELMMRGLARGIVLREARGRALARYRAFGDERLSVSRNLFSEKPLRSQYRVLEKLVEELGRAGRLDAYASAVGTAYHSLALMAFQQGFEELGRECLRIGRGFGGRQAVSRTWAGRMLVLAIGVERKERLVKALARRGLMTPQRRRYAALRRLALGGGGPAALRIVAWPAWRPENPYTGLLYDAIRARGVEVVDFTPARLAREALGALGGTRRIVWHLHWPERMLNEPRAVLAAARAGALVALAAIARAAGVTLAWTAHNVVPHERRHPRLERWFARSFYPRLHGYVALTEGGRSAVREVFPALASRPSFVVPHGHYRGVYGAAPDRREARLLLGIGSEVSCVVGFLGQVRPYKGVPALLSAFRASAGPGDVLLVAGEPVDDELRDALLRAATRDRRIRVVPRFIPGHDVRWFLGAMDLVALPYTEVLNSGTALLALSLDRPVLVPRQGALEELAALVGPEWVRTYDGELDARVLEEAMRWSRNVPRTSCAALEALDWGRIADATVNALQRIQGTASRDPRPRFSSALAR